MLRVSIYNVHCSLVSWQLLVRTRSRAGGSLVHAGRCFFFFFFPSGLSYRLVLLLCLDAWSSDLRLLIGFVVGATCLGHFRAVTIWCITCQDVFLIVILSFLIC